MLTEKQLSDKRSYGEGRANSPLVGVVCGTVSSSITERQVESKMNNLNWSEQQERKASFVEDSTSKRLFPHSFKIDLRPRRWDN